MAAPKIIVVGGGLAGLAAVIKIAEMAARSTSFDRPVKRSHSVCAQGGINAAKNLKAKRFYLQAFRRHHLRWRFPRQPAARQGHVRGCSRHHRSPRPHGVPFNRTPKAFSTSAASEARSITAPLCRSHHRSATSLRARRASSPLRVRGQSKKVRALGVPLRRARRNPHLPRHLRDGFTHHGSPHLPCRRHHHRHRRLRRHLRQSTNSVVCTGSAQSALYQQAATTPTANSFRCIPPASRRRQLRLMSESARGEGGRVWVPRTAGDKRDPKSIPKKNAGTSRRVVSEIRQPRPARCGHARDFKVVFEEKLGIDGQPMVYLDLTHIDAKTLDRKLEGILEIYEKLSATIRASRP